MGIIEEQVVTSSGDDTRSFSIGPAYQVSENHGTEVIVATNRTEDRNTYRTGLRCSRYDALARTEHKVAIS